MYDYFKITSSLGNVTEFHFSFGLGVKIVNNACPLCIPFLRLRNPNLFVLVKYLTTKLYYGTLCKDHAVKIT